MKDCLQCGECCKWVKFPLVGKMDLDWALTRGLDVPEDDPIEVPIEGIRYATFYKPCQYLVDNKCSIEDRKPQACRNYYCKKML
jgi:Fe-S-cluster containining protein